MMYFYIALTVLSAAGMVFEMILRYTENIKNFGIARKLFKFKGKTIPVENMLPQSVIMALLYFFVIGISGLWMVFLSFDWWLSLPCALFCGSLFCLLVQYNMKFAVKKFQKKEMPKDDEASGTEGYLTRAITISEYGLIKFEWKGDEYEAPAFSADDGELPLYERVIIILEENGCYCVEGVSEVYKIFKEN